MCMPSKCAGSDSETFWLRPVRAITASMQPESGQIVYTRSEFLHLIQFCSSYKGPDHTVQNPACNWSGWCGQILAQWIRSGSKPVSKNRRVWFWQNVTRQLPVSLFQAPFHSSTDSQNHILQNQPRSSLAPAVSGQMDPVWKQASMQESLSPLLGNTFEPIQMWCESDPACSQGKWLFQTTPCWQLCPCGGEWGWGESQQQLPRQGILRPTLWPGGVSQWSSAHHVRGWQWKFYRPSGQPEGWQRERTGGRWQRSQGEWVVGPVRQWGMFTSAGNNGDHHCNAVKWETVFFIWKV